MVDSLSPLPPIGAPRVAKAKITEKDPHHHQGEHQHKEKKEEEEIHDEVIIHKDEPAVEERKSIPALPLSNIDIEV